MQIFKRNGRPRYYARWQHNGKDYLRSTGETSERLAIEAGKRLVAKCEGKVQVGDDLERLEKQLCESVSDEDRRDSIERLVELLRTLIASEAEERQPHLRSQVVRQLQAGQKQRIAIRDCWRAWSENSNRKYEPKASTLLGYGAIWKRFEKWGAKRAIQFLHEVTSDQCLAYSSDLWTSKVSPSTFNQHVAFLRAMFALLEKEAGLTDNPWAKINKKQKNKGEGRRNLSEEELKKVLFAAEGNFRLMFYIGLFTGFEAGGCGQSPLGKY